MCLDPSLMQGKCTAVWVLWQLQGLSIMLMLTSWGGGCVKDSCLQGDSMVGGTQSHDPHPGIT